MLKILFFRRFKLELKMPRKSKNQQLASAMNSKRQTKRLQRGVNTNSEFTNDNLNGNSNILSQKRTTISTITRS